MNVDVGLWAKLTRAVIVLLFVAGALGVAVWYLPVFQQNERMRKEILRRDQQIQKEEETARQLKAAFNALSNDPKTVERLAREQLGYAKSGETVIRFEPPSTTNPPAR